MKTRAFGLFTVAAAASVAAFAACSSEDGAQGTSSGATAASTGQGGASSAATGTGGDIFGTSTGAGGGGGQDECASDEQEATIVKQPVDIVFVIDNSGSMGDEILSVQDNVSVNFASIIEGSGLDYRVVMLSRHGDYDGPESICVSTPLSGTSCSPIPAEPVNNPPIFFHHSVEVDSHNAWCQILDQFALPDEFNLQLTGYQEVLRPEAFKTFVVITDDNVGCGPYDDNNDATDGMTSAAQFDADLLALSPAQFGDATKRNYVFHSIIALAPFDANDLTLPHPPDQPIVTAECSPGAQNPGTGYQALSSLTGGLRYPTCGLDFTTIFQKIAEGVIAGAKVDCAFPLPTPPEGQELDPSTILVVYTPGDGGAAETFTQVADASLCGPGLFYIANDVITLCDEACAEVQADDTAKVKILSGCKTDDPT